MSEQLPAPDFDYQKYERPNQDWVCGWACDGKPCRNGPSPKGECRGKAECRPKLERLSGEEKGRWRCTLPREHGGPCESGPLPDGTCCRAIPPCVPTRSLRAKRGRLCLAVLAMLAGLLLTLGYSSWAWKFVSPGEVSSHHRDGAFVSLRQSGSSAEGCTACHEAANGGPAKWLHAAITANPGPFELHKIAGHTREVTLLDQSCIKCHATHNFHQPGTTRDHSCSACHKEHQGNGPMPPPSSRECASCHNDTAVMAASREKASRLPPEVFDIRAKPGMNTFLPARPKDGRTSVFASFSAGHPEFQVIREKLREENSLKFNHEKHLTGAIPLINGKQLACADCHQPDSAGKYFQRVSFQTHCRSCHSLQFDAENPELSLPHGEATAVRSFLRSLPTQYTELAKDRGITREEEIEKFVRDQMSRLRRLAASGENLEQQVFFTSDPAQTPPTASRDVSAGRPRFAGCAYCHEVKPGRDQIPMVTKPIIPDRWMPGGEFNHAKHNKISCVQCHTVHQSRDTADIVLPSKDNCASCHSPQGGVSESCALCHSFHFTKKEMTKR